MNARPERTCPRCAGYTEPRRDCVCAGTGIAPMRHPAFGPWPMAADQRCPYVLVPTLHEELEAQVREEAAAPKAYFVRGSWTASASFARKIAGWDPEQRQEEASGS